MTEESYFAISTVESVVKLMYKRLFKMIIVQIVPDSEAGEKGRDIPIFYCLDTYFHAKAGCS